MFGLTRYIYIHTHAILVMKEANDNFDIKTYNDNI